MNELMDGWMDGWMRDISKDHFYYSLPQLAPSTKRAQWKGESDKEVGVKGIENKITLRTICESFQIMQTCCKFEKKGKCDRGVKEVKREGKSTLENFWVWIKEYDARKTNTNGDTNKKFEVWAKKKFVSSKYIASFYLTQ